MTYQQAEKLRNDLLSMIGETHGIQTISDVVIAPVDDELFEKWIEEYKRTGDGVLEVLPYAKFDLKVLFIYSINNRHYSITGMMPYQNVLSATKDFGFEIDLDRYKD